MHIRAYEDADREAVVRLSLRAWAPVFESLKGAMSAELYRTFYPDWRVSQAQAVEAACAEFKSHTWVAEVDGTVAGFAALKMHPDQLGEIYMIAVDPQYQRNGIARALIEFTLRVMKEAGVTVAMVETGSDPGHAPARETYDRCGFELVPASRYFKKL